MIARITDASATRSPSTPHTTYQDVIRWIGNGDPTTGD
jgi:hypothetical protein